MTNFNITAGALAISIGLLSAQSVYAAEAQASDPQATEEQQSGIVDIIVTAQRRAENLQNVPIAITALSNDQLTNSGVTGTTTLQNAVPGLAFNTSLGQNGQPRVRGIGTTANGPGIENPVATYVDGVYLASAAATLISLDDVEQVAVLKGPQGTLFGRNATGGLIQITTRTPTQDFMLNARATVKTHDGQEGSLYMAGGLGDGLAASIAVRYDRLGNGFGTNLFNGEPTLAYKTFGTRGKLQWKPGEGTTVTLSGDYTYYTGSDFSGRSIGRNGFGELPLGGYWDVNANYTAKAIARQGGGSLKIQQEFGGVELMSISAYRKSQFTQAFDQDQSAQPATFFQGDFFVRQKDRQFSQEFQLLSTGNGPFKWVLGGIYFNGFAEFVPNIISSSRPLPPAAVTILAQQTLKSYAGFAQGSYDIGEATTLTAGLRYTSDARQLNTNISRAPFPGVLANYQANKTFNRLTWRLSLDHRFSPELLVYASYNRGFKSGAFIPSAAAPTEVKPEILDAYEVGFKADLADRTLRINGSAFYYDYENTQVTSIITNQIRLINATGSRHYGFELDAQYQPVDNFNINFGLSYVNAKFKAFPNAVRSFPLPSPLPAPAFGNGGSILAAYDASAPTNTSRNFSSVLCFPSGTIGVGTNVCDATGNQPQNTPKLTFNLGADYTIDTSFGKVILAGSYYYNDGFFVEADNRVRQPSYSLVNLSLTWKSNDDRYSLRLWGNNVGNAKYALQIVQAENGDNRLPAQGRLLGATLGVNF